MHKQQADYQDADLVLRVYDMRREAVMRESRNAINGQFWPKSYEDVAAILKPEHPHTAAYRQVLSYWEMVYGMVRHGIVHADYFLESNTEGLFVFAKLAPYLDQLRKDYSPNALRNCEWVSRETATGKRVFEQISTRVKQITETK